MRTATLPNRGDAPTKRYRAPGRRNGRVNLRLLDVEQLATLAEELDGEPVPGVRMTEVEFVKWSLDRVHAEWVDGEVILMAPVSDAHDSVERWLTTVLYLFVEAKSLGVVRGDMFVRFGPRRRRRVPDLMFISNARRSRIRPTYIEGAPDVVFEIISVDSRNRDRRDKYFDYEAGGVREYWMIDPLNKTIDAYALRGRKYEEIQPVEDRIESKVLPGLFLRGKWVFGKQLPKVSQVLKEFGIKG